MALYELSIDAGLIREAQRIVSLEGRGYPTLVMQWESRLFDQPWTTTIVLDYLIALPPLITGQSTFNEVRIAAFVDGAPTKFFYFGTEMTADVARIAPEMENAVAPAKVYQEFRLEERTCPVPYLKLIQATPRIFGNGPQDYYSPPIKVERYDGVVGPEHIADFFPTIVANLETVPGSVLTDAARGFWTGGRFVGVSEIAIRRQGKVVGLHRRGRDTAKPGARDPLPPELKRRDPKLDVLKQWVAVDFGASTTVVAMAGAKGAPELLRLGTRSPAARARDFENPSEVAFENLGRTVKAWRDRVILPMTRWEDVVVGHAARAYRVPAAPPLPGGRDSGRPPPPRPAADPLRVAASVTELPLLRERIEQSETVRLRGAGDPEPGEVLKKPAPPVIDEDGIGAHDPFDPVELYAYYVGLYVNQRSRGLSMRYLVAMPTGWPSPRRESVLVAFRRGLYRSLPAGLVAFEDLEALEVLDAGPAAIPFAAQAFRVFGIQAKPEGVPFCAIDAGGSETGVVCGIFRPARPEEKERGYDRVLEHLPPLSIGWLGGERLLHRLAWRVHAASPSMRELGVPLEPPPDEETSGDAGGLLARTLEARTNTVLLKDALRPVLERDASTKVPASLKLLSGEGKVVEAPIVADREALDAVVSDWLERGATEIRRALATALTKIGKEPDPYDGLRVLIGGRLSGHAAFQAAMTRDMPESAKVHLFQEPDKTNVGAPTAKTACALGALGMRLDRTGAVARSEQRDAFRYRVGRARHGQLADVLDPSVDYDTWREMGACSKPDVEILFMKAEGDEVAADDPRVMRAVCSLGPDAVGQRVYLRAVASDRIEVSVGPPGGEPEDGAPCWGIDLTTSLASPLKE